MGARSADRIYVDPGARLLLAVSRRCRAIDTEEIRIERSAE
jgi:hypothetical protein